MGDDVFFFNHSLTSTISVTADLNYFRRFSWVMYLTVTSFNTENMGVSRFDPVRIGVFLTKVEADRTGQRTGSPEDYCAFLSIFSPLF